MVITRADRSVSVTLGDQTTHYTNNIPAATREYPVSSDHTSLTPGEHFAIGGVATALSVGAGVGAAAAIIAGTAGSFFLLAVMAVAFGFMAKYFFEAGSEAKAEQAKTASPARATAIATRVDTRGTMAPGASAALQPPKVA